MKENRHLKFGLVLQSFVPLFLLLLIKYGSFAIPRLVFHFIEYLFSDFRTGVRLALAHPLLWNTIIAVFCLGWILYAILVGFGFHGIHSSGFISMGEKIKILEEKKDAGLSFLISFVLPLFVDDLNDLRHFVLLASMLSMVICLLSKSDLFYQNPVLAFCGYKVYSFSFQNPSNDIPNSQQIFYGISHDKIPSPDGIVKRKYIADNVFLVMTD